jgi:hypothetical protein
LPERVGEDDPSVLEYEFEFEFRFKFEFRIKFRIKLRFEWFINVLRK